MTHDKQLISYKIMKLKIIEIYIFITLYIIIYNNKYYKLKILTFPKFLAPICND
jgi:hypothetical protein